MNDLYEVFLSVFKRLTNEDLVDNYNRSVGRPGFGFSMLQNHEAMRFEFKERGLTEEGDWLDFYECRVYFNRKAIRASKISDDLMNKLIRSYLMEYVPDKLNFIPRYAVIEKKPPQLRFGLSWWQGVYELDLNTLIKQGLHKVSSVLYFQHKHMCITNTSLIMRISSIEMKYRSLLFFQKYVDVNILNDGKLAIIKDMMYPSLFLENFAQDYLCCVGLLNGVDFTIQPEYLIDYSDLSNCKELGESSPYLLDIEWLGSKITKEGNEIWLQ